MPLGSHQTIQKRENKHIKTRNRTLKVHGEILSKPEKYGFNVDIPAMFDKVFPRGSMAWLLNTALNLIQPN